MARPLTWRSLTIGLVALGVIALIAAGVLTFARIGQLRGETVSIYMVTNAAKGVIKGTEVWVGGQQVGVVDDVRFRAATVDTTERILIQMSVLQSYLDHIRKGADVQLRPGANLIGAPVVYISMGRADQPPLQPNDTLRARAQIEDRNTKTADFTALGDSLVAVANAVRDLSQHAQRTGGEIVTLRRRAEAQAAEVGGAITALSNRSLRSDGTLSRLVADTTLRTSAHRVTAQADSIRTLLNSRSTSLGRFRRDSSIFVEAQRVSVSIDTLRARFSSLTTLGTLGRADSALSNALSRTRSQLDSLVADAKRHPLRYLSL